MTGLLSGILGNDKWNSLYIVTHEFFIGLFAIVLYNPKHFETQIDCVAFQQRRRGHVLAGRAHVFCHL